MINQIYAQVRCSFQRKAVQYNGCAYAKRVTLVSFTAYQTLLKAYISEGLRKDEALYAAPSERLLEVLRKHGVSDQTLANATRDLVAA